MKIKINLKKNIDNLYNKIKNLESINEELLNHTHYKKGISNITNENLKLNGIINNINKDIINNKKKTKFYKNKLIISVMKKYFLLSLNFLFCLIYLNNY